MTVSPGSATSARGGGATADSARNVAAVERDCAHAGPTRRAGVDRALRAVGTCTYCSARAGVTPSRRRLGTHRVGFDCSGFARGASARPQERRDRWWLISTDSIVRDATAATHCSASCRPGRSGPVTRGVPRPLRRGPARRDRPRRRGRRGRADDRSRRVRTATGRAVAAWRSASAMVGRGGGRGGATAAWGCRASPGVCGATAAHPARRSGTPRCPRGRRRPDRVVGGVAPLSRANSRAPRARGRSESGRA